MPLASLPCHIHLDEKKKRSAEEQGVKILYWSYKTVINDESVDSFIKNNGIRPYHEKDDIAMKIPAENGIDIAPVLDLPSHESEHRESEIVIQQYKLSGEYVAQFDNVSKASSQVSVSVSSIWKCIHGQRNVAGGYIWKREQREDLPQINISPLEPKKTMVEYLPKAVDQYDRDGHYLRTFESIRSASREIKVNTKSITDALNGRQKTAGGYVWKYSKSNPDGS